MDKDRSVDFQAPCSWVDMHQFIGDLLSSGAPPKGQPDARNAAWGLKASSLEPLQSFRPAPDKRDAAPGARLHPGAPQRRGPDTSREDLRHTCTCPSCPYSSSASSRHMLQSESTCQPKDLSISMCVPDTTVPASSSRSELKSSETSPSQVEDADRGTQSDQLNSSTPPSRASSSSLSHLSMFPSFCCHRGLRTCSGVLGGQEGTAPPFSHTHHHFHHHHCALTSCLPCPQLSAPLPCLSCPCSFGHSRHKQAEPQEERGRRLVTPHPCMHCTASFSRPSQLLQHQRSEHAHKPPGFLCTECGRAFNSHSNLRIHLNVHTGARPYSCPDCGKSFSQSGALKIHRRTHTGERPYSCSFCDRGFPNLAGVRAHQRIHTGEKPYRCGHCGKCFTQSGALKIHIRIHTGERPFLCSLCGKAFSNRSGIRFHHRTVHGLTEEHTGESGGTACSPGRPRTTHNRPDISVSHTAPLGSSQTIAHPGSAPISDAESRLPGEGGSRRKAGLLYACEDCGLRFKDAPSRNRHQTLEHYSHERREEEEEEQREEFSPREAV
ncbi:Zinc finger protein 239 [Oryzias melastigma]|uniref:Si:ch211-79k12.2 n=1 Tax=Oryzias melastigma TaxID=30732 RepID=A0A3B3BU90_ORYME|nr:zinc finger protein 491 [Oryzias melastigma]KAF6739866.1 Zinc finger protein 239 [Oryzias melastigma]